MKGIHDLGGVDGMGPVGATLYEPKFHAEWEKSVFAMFPFGAAAGIYGVDEFRRFAEKLNPVHFLTGYYYEHWLHSIEALGVKKGFWTEEELDRRTEYHLNHPQVTRPDFEVPAHVDFAQWAAKTGFSSAREVAADPKFKVSDRVLIDNSVPRKHHRRPGYAMGRIGEITHFHGGHVFPDTTANDLPETAEYLYTVRFTETEIYGAEDADPNAAHYCDMWEPYITLAKD